MKTVVLFPALLTLLFFSCLQSIKNPYELPISFEKPLKWVKKDNERKIVEFYWNKYSDTMSIDGVLKIIKSERNFMTFISAKSWCIKNYNKAFPELVKLIKDTTTVGLNNTADLIVRGRDLPFYGHGGVIFEDIFTVSGRASYILNQLTGEDFAVVKPTTKFEDLEKFQTEWLRWIKDLKTKAN